MPSPDVSVVLPSRDRGSLLAGAVMSAAAQEGVGVEVIVVDDGSVVPITLARPERLRPERLQVLRHDRSMGVAAARNTGIAAATGRWVAFLDDDDLWAPVKLHRQVEEAERTGAVFAYASGVVIRQDGGVVATSDAPDPATLDRAILTSNVIPCGCSNVVVRTDCLNSLGGFDPSFSIFADWDLHIRLSGSGRAAAVREPLIAYTLHAGNLHLDEAAATGELARFDAKHLDARRARGVAVDGVDYARWRAGSYRAVGDRRRAASAFWRLAVLRRSPADAARALAIRLGAGADRRSHGPRDLDGPSWLGPLLVSSGRVRAS
jgi:glycosyltransferase involved in cell wall biosynthesis